MILRGVADCQGTAAEQSGVSGAGKGEWLRDGVCDAGRESAGDCVVKGEGAIT